jgi:hypothetical protein
MCLIRAEEKTPFVSLHVWLHFPRFLPNEHFVSEGLFPSEEDDALKQIQAFFSTTRILSGPSPGSQPLTTEMAIFVKSRLKT